MSRESLFLLRRAPRKHGDPRTTGRAESASARRRRKRREQRVPECAMPLCKHLSVREGMCWPHQLVVAEDA